MTTATIIEQSLPQKKERHFLAQSFTCTNWDAIAPYAKNLLERPINSVKDLEQFLHDKSEFNVAISEYFKWLFIKTSCDTTNELYQKEYAVATKDIKPKLNVLSQKIDQKILNSAYLPALDDKYYFVYLRSLKNNIALYNEANVALGVEVSLKAKKYNVIIGSLTVEVDGKELTLLQAEKFLKSTDRTLRKRVFKIVNDKLLAHRECLHELLSELIDMRHQIALNAGFDNYRDYKFAALGRFDYTPEDCFDFHEAIASEIVPVAKKMKQDKKEKLGFENYKPWDKDAPILGKKTLKPFTNTTEMVEKTIECLRLVKPEFATYLRIMDEMGHLDLSSRKGKAPGGYNCTLHEVGVPFIFMNAVGSLRDLTTMVHESGHAVHSFLSRDLDLMFFKSTPSEVSELASMSMELLSMEHWSVFFDNEDDLRRAKIEQLEKVISGFSWIATIDSFQHWLYTNPKHTVKERNKAWLDVSEKFTMSVADWTGLEEYKVAPWQRQLHIYQVPFYYIEYAMAQLGAIAVWRAYKKNPTQALLNYTNALKLGNTKTITEVYETAGIKFDFSKAYVCDLMHFVVEELNALKEKI